MIAEVHAIITQAIEQYKPRAIFAMYSGGDDSVCAAHLASQHNFTAAVLVDTGIAIKQAHEHAKQTCEAQDWPLLVYKSPYDYEALVLKYGFPGPSQHRVMYIQLKERAIDALVRDYKQGRRDHIMLITGVRKQESMRRLETVTAPIVKRKSKIWVAPMWNWSREERDQYIADNNLPRNPIKPLIHVSGDCLCGRMLIRANLNYCTSFSRLNMNGSRRYRQGLCKNSPGDGMKNRLNGGANIKRGRGFWGMTSCRFAGRAKGGRQLMVDQ